MSALILSRLHPAIVPYHQHLDPDMDLYLVVDEGLLGPGEREALAPHYKRIIPVKGFSTGGLPELVALDLHKEVRFSHVVAPSEFDLLRAAKLRQRLGLPGQSPASALAFRDKILMKELVAKAGLRVPRARRVHNAVDVIEFVEEHGYPVVTKPVAGASGVNTWILRSRADLEAMLQAGLSASLETSPDLEVEEFVEGDLYHVNGLWLEGKPAAIWPSSYLGVDHLTRLHGPVLGGLAASCTLSPSNPLSARLNRFVEDVLKALPTPPATTFHAEVFHTRDDEIVLCEVASRTAGASIHVQFYHALGLDLARALVRVQAGLPVFTEGVSCRAEPSPLVGLLVIPSREGTLVDLPETCPFPWVIQYRASGKRGTRYPSARTWMDTVASLQLAGSTEEEVQQRLQEVATWLDRQMVWAPVS
jgi:hypothetical protein